MDREFLEPLFLGPNAENLDLLESLVVDAVRDHGYWRRNFHPEDGIAIPPAAQYRPEYLETVARIREELQRLGAELKRAVPFFSPRYLGHMNADLLLPGLVAKIVTSLYNPNNVSEEAAPVTLEKELEVGQQLARMFGFAVDDDREPCAWGHLTSGGTVANYEALWNLRSVKFYGIALAEAAAGTDHDFGPVGPAAKPLADYSKWELLNLTLQQVIDLRRQVAGQLRGTASREELIAFSKAVKAQRIESLGTAGFFLEHADLTPPRVLVPVSAHYSWEKSMKVLGLGTSNLVEVPVDDTMRLDVDALRGLLDEQLDAGHPVLAVVGVLGTTEFGTLDPVAGIVAARREQRARGRDFGIHVDAAWGGYLASVFREVDGRLIPRERLRKDFHYFPSEVVHETFAALPEVDSITVDPHKLGYVPYAAGAFVARDRRVVDFITQKAAYVFDLGEEAREVPMAEKLHNLGQYILEGSKSGASAAAVWVTHQVLPLHREGFGRLLVQTIRSCEFFYDRMRELAARLEGRVHLCVPFEPDSNLLCLAANPAGNRDVAVANRFLRGIFAHMRVDPDQPVQVKQFIGSYTSLLEDRLPADQAGRILGALGLDPATFRALPDDPAREADHVYLLRHTLMNPWVMAEDEQGRNLLDKYLTFLEERLLAELAATR